MARILLIEDDDKFRKMLVMLLETSGHEVAEAEDGTKGLETFSGSNFDLIITDIFMPDQDGLEVVRAVTDQQADVKILVISGGGRQGAFQYLEYAKIFGADKTLVKPFENQEFLSVVDKLLTA
ncbi:MAG: response regulator [Desulfobacter sp.]